jgi:predicted DNA-binding transcriptional regulator YafY
VDGNQAAYSQGWHRMVKGTIQKSDIPFFAKFIICLRSESTAKNPPELVDHIKRLLSEIMAKYDS